LISCGGGIGAPLRRIAYREWKLQFSYQKYNQVIFALQAAPGAGG
jgi:hypothetical protein